MHVFQINLVFSVFDENLLIRFVSFFNRNNLSELQILKFPIQKENSEHLNTPSLIIIRNLLKIVFQLQNLKDCKSKILK